MTNTSTLPYEISSTAQRPQARLRGPLFLYSLLVLTAYPIFRFLLGPDAISYISIARHYVQGDWAEALNPYWSPLLSWLIAPLIAIHIPGLMAAKLVCIFSGFAVLWSLQRLLKVLSLSSLYGSAALYTAAVMVASFSLLWVTPDLLTAAIVLWYFSVIFSSRYRAEARAGLICGLIGVLAYLSKAYNFYFFLAHFSIVSAILWKRSESAERVRVLRHFAAGLVVFVIGCSPWIATVTGRAHGLTIGSASEWNRRLVGPDSPGFPQFYRLIPPSSPNALSMWENPSPSLLPPWNPFASTGNLKHQARIIATNLEGIVAILAHASVFCLAGLFIYLLRGLSQPRGTEPLWLLVITTVVILPAGYVLVTLRDRYVWDDRYLWAGILLAMLTCFLTIQETAGSLSPFARKAALAFCALSFAAIPLRELISKRNLGRDVYDVSVSLRKEIPAGSSFATCGEWNEGIGMAFYLNARFYGATGITPDEKEFRAILNPEPSPSGIPKALGPEEISRSLRDYRVGYLLILPHCPVEPSSSILNQRIETPGRPEIKLYRVSS